MRLAVLGDPLTFTLSPELHRAGLEAAGMRGVSQALPTPVAVLGERLAALAEAGYRGLNLTMPLKEAALAHVTRASEAARRARSINTLVPGQEGWWGETTDGPGLVDLLRTLGRIPARERCVLLGAGGAARSLALALLGEGAAAPVVSARRPEQVKDGWDDLGAARIVPWGSDDERRFLAEATLVVNATPAADDALPLEALAPRALLLDLRYGARPTAWVERARATGREAYDGLGLLVFQARRSLSLWLGREIPVAPLAAAVGWPR